MAFPLTFDGHTSDGFEVKIIHLPNAPKDAVKMVDIRQSMIRNGWVGRPVILIEHDGYHQALTGSHRLCAAVGLDLEIEAVVYDSATLGEQFFIDLDKADRDEGLLRVLISHELDDAISVMRDEISNNLKA